MRLNLREISLFNNFLKGEIKMLKKSLKRRSKKNLTPKDILKINNYFKEQEYIKFFQTYKTSEQHQKQINGFYYNCSKYLENPFSYIPKYTDDLFEYRYMTKAIKILGPLTKPHNLADFLDIDVDIVFDAIEKGVIPCFAYDGIYSIKTKEIFPFLSKIHPHQRYRNEY